MANKKVKIVKPVEPYVPKEKTEIYIYRAEKNYWLFQMPSYSYDSLSYKYLKLNKIKI